MGKKRHSPKANDEDKEPSDVGFRKLLGKDLGSLSKVMKMKPDQESSSEKRNGSKRRTNMSLTAPGVVSPTHIEQIEKKPQPAKPAPPDFESFRLSKVDHSENEVRGFWEKYTRDIESYNRDVVIHWMEIFGKHNNRTGIDKHDNEVVYPDDVEMSWLPRWGEFLPTHFETNKFVVSRHVHSNWFQPTCLDLSGPLGSLDYWRRNEEDDILQVPLKGDGSFKFGNVEFRLTIFNYFERRKAMKDVLTSGHRFKFCSRNVEDGTFKVFAKASAGKTKVNIEFETMTDDDKRVLTLFVNKKIPAEKVHSYLCANSKGWLEFVIDIPIAPVTKVFMEVPELDNNKIKKRVRICTVGVLAPSTSDEED